MRSVQVVKVGATICGCAVGFALAIWVMGYTRAGCWAMYDRQSYSWQVCMSRGQLVELGGGYRNGRE